MTSAETLFSEHRQRLFRYFCRAVGPNEASDLTQDVFVRVTRSPIPTASPGDLRPWLFRIARNLALDHHRRQERRPAADAAIEPPTVAHATTQETRLALNQALRAVDPLDRDLFLMREVAGLSYEELARACDLTPDAVRSRLHRTRLKLRDLLSTSIHDIRVQPMRMTGVPK